MAVHMFRIVAEKPSGVTETKANQMVDQWLTKFTPWTADTVEHNITVVDPLDTSVPTYFHGNLRFKQTNTMSAIRNQMETDLTNVVTWYQIGYHKCDHDENSQTGCSWDDIVTYGTVPSGVSL